jgi:hypothetical protein
MTDPELTSAQRQVLGRLPGRMPPARLDRVWIFAPHQAKTRETGLFVLSLFPEEDEGTEQRILLTLRYERETAKGGDLLETLSEEGRAPRELIERVIAGVLLRSGEESGEPIVEAIDGSDEAWESLVRRLNPYLDPPNRE